MATDAEKEMLDDIEKIRKGWPRIVKDAKWDIGSVRRTVNVGLEPHPDKHLDLGVEAERAANDIGVIVAETDAQAEKVLNAKKRTTSDLATLRARVEDANNRINAKFEVIRTNKQILESETYGNIRQSA